MKRIPVLLMLVIMLVSCSSGPDVPAENKTVAEAIDPSTLLLRITGNDAAGSDVALDCRWIPAKEAVSGTLLATAEFDGYDLGSIIFESGSITYTFKGTLNGTEFIAESIAIISDELVASGPATDNATTGITINMEETGIGEGAFTAEVSSDASGNASLIITGTIELPGIEGSDITIAKQDAEDFLAILEEIQRMSFAMVMEQDEYWDIDYASDKMTATLKKEYVDEATGNRFLKNDGTMSRAGSTWTVHEEIIAIIDGVRYEVSNHTVVEGTDNPVITRTVIINGTDISDSVPVEMPSLPAV